MKQCTNQVPHFLRWVHSIHPGRRQAAAGQCGLFSCSFWAWLQWCGRTQCGEWLTRAFDFFQDFTMQLAILWPVVIRFRPFAVIFRTYLQRVITHLIGYNLMCWWLVIRDYHFGSKKPRRSLSKVIRYTSRQEFREEYHSGRFEDDLLNWKEKWG